MKYRIGHYGYDEKGEVLDENVTFTITCKMRKRWAPHFVSMLLRMQFYGWLGMSRVISIFSDGDGDFRPEFDISTPNGEKIPEVEPREEKDGDCFYDPG